MPTIHREAGIAFRVYSRDHGPPHVHAVKGTEFVRIEIGNADVAPSVSLVSRRMRDPDVVIAVRVVEREWVKFLAAWRTIHGQANADR
jgi:hypothetical protein